MGAVSAPGRDRVAANLVRIRERIAAAGGDLARITIVAVTKGFGPEVVAAARAAGLGDLGENYAAELVDKAQLAATDRAGGPLRWHFLGAVQRNKVGRLAPHVHLWQSVDRIEAGRAIARHRPGAQVLLQVDLSGDPGKAGCPRSEAPELVRGLRGLDLEVAGVMGVGPNGPPEGARPGFRWLAALAGDLGLAEVSMGMSDDLEVAVEEGATMVRVGRGLFGPRPAVAGLQR